MVEILVHNLETESSLHRRVDLFFLVDSIAQCSRGLKGNCLSLGYSGVLLTKRKEVMCACVSVDVENISEYMQLVLLMYENLIFQEMLVECIHLLCKQSCHAYCLLLPRLEILHKKIVGSVLRQVEGVSCSLKLKYMLLVVHLFFGSLFLLTFALRIM